MSAEVVSHSSPSVSIIIPCLNEHGTLDSLLGNVQRLLPGAEIIVVDDGSSPPLQVEDGVTLLRHPYNMGNGASVKTGARKASGDVLIFMDADGQHNPTDIPRLLEKLEQGFDMTVGARKNYSHASAGRSLANRFYNRLASWMVGQKVEDLTSGFRAVRARKFKEFLHLLPNGFSYPTTITMAFFRTGYPVSYIPVHTASRIGRSHIRPLKDGIRFLLIIFRIGVLYSPLKLFLPVALLHVIVGTGYYAYTYYFYNRLSMATVFMLTSAVMIFLIGLVSEQITQLTYRPTKRDNND